MLTATLLAVPSHRFCRLVRFTGVALVALSSAAQSPKGSRPEFEVASIKLNHTGERLYYKSYSTRFTARNMTTKLLMELAWQTGASPISGAQDWFSSQGFDIEATSDRPVTWGEMQLMFQSLLESRFRLTFHRQTKEGPVYVLVVDKGGLRMRPSPDQTPWTGDHPNEPGTTGATMDIRQGSLTGDSIPMAMFIGFLRGETGRPMMNRTGLTGRYAVELKWTPFRTPAASGVEVSQPDGRGESLFTALQTQLGLKLESSKGPVEHIFIDRLERPSEN
jgi:uncharacterized protein (TIGR03435 family)